MRARSSVPFASQLPRPARRAKRQKNCHEHEMKCVYCGGEATTKDHVPARCLLERPYPLNLRTVPSCIRCNNGYALDEEYFLATLAQIGTNSSLERKIEQGGVVDRAFERSPAFEERFIRSMEVGPEGRPYFRPEHERIERVIQKTAFGLFVVRYKRNPSLSDIRNTAAYPYNIDDSRPATRFLATYRNRFQTKRWTDVQRGVFSYIVVRDSMAGNQLTCIMDFHQTLWGIAELPEPSSIGPHVHRRREVDSPTQQSLFD